MPQLTETGKEKVKPYISTKLKSGAKLMIIFDIPEENAILRNRLRRLLQRWEFTQAQKSVWITSYDYKEHISKAVSVMELANYVEIYECARLNLSKTK